MTRAWRDLAARAAAALWLAASPGVRAAADTHPPPRAHFEDQASLVKPEAAARLDARLRAFESETGHQVVVAVFQALPAGASLEEFTVRTAQAWRVGRKGLDDGVVLFVFVRDRRLRLEVGYGLEDEVPDAVARRILDDVIAPRFRAGDPSRGLEAGVDAILAAIQGRGVPAALAAAPPAPGTRVIVLSAEDLQSFFGLIWGLVAAILAANERPAWRGLSHGRRAALLAGGVLLAVLGLLFAFRWLARIAAVVAAVSLWSLASRPDFARKLAGRAKGASDASGAAAGVARAWLFALAIALGAWGVLPRGEWKGWSLGSVAAFAALQGFSALIAWRGRRLWALRLLGVGTMAALAVAFFFPDAYLFGVLPAPALPVAFPLAWMALALLAMPVLTLLRLEPDEWWFPQGESLSGGSGSWSSGGSSSGSSSSGFSGGGGSFGGGGASGSW